MKTEFKKAYRSLRISSGALYGFPVEYVLRNHGAPTFSSRQFDANEKARALIWKAAASSYAARG